ncbi:DUF3151 domain-containing protein [Janibacter sp. GS2]|uniref:DUF3151 domain-containing protein n=1 Tax=Janibacter sp. GS2 TaxID=3442646 RepID=UPI003EC0BE42
MDNLLHIPETKLPEDPSAARIDAGEDAASVAADLPSSSLPWAVLAEGALDGGRTIEAYAYARTGYHRGLDALRRSGWKGQGPVPWSHLPNRGFLRALATLAQAADQIGETEEEQRCSGLLADSSPEAARELLG